MANKVLVVIVIIIVAVGAFFGGIKYQQSKIPAAGAFGQGGAGAGFRRVGAGQNGQSVRGQIISSDTGTLTIKLMDGSTKIVVLSGSTNITKAASGTKEDLKAGQQVMVFGSNNSDGSVTAQIVQLNPMFRRTSGGAANSATGNTTATPTQ